MPRMFGPVLVRAAGAGAMIADRRAVPRAAPDVVPRSVGRSVRHRLPADQRADGGGSRRMVRRGPRRIGAEALVPARSAHRLHPRGDRRRTRLRRRVRDHRAVRGPGRSRVLGRPEVRGNEPPFRRLLRLRHRPVDVAAELRLDRREPRPAADEGPDPAADFLGRLQRADDLRGARAAAARLVRTRSRAAPGRASARRSAGAGARRAVQPRMPAARHRRRSRCRRSRPSRPSRAAPAACASVSNPSSSVPGEDRHEAVRSPPPIPTCIR